VYMVSTARVRPWSHASRYRSRYGSVSTQCGDGRLWQRLLARPVSGSGRLRHGEGTRGWGAQPPEGAKVAYALKLKEDGRSKVCGIG
jgi:hypothetical protein